MTLRQIRLLLWSIAGLALLAAGGLVFWAMSGSHRPEIPTVSAAGQRARDTVAARPRAVVTEERLASVMDVRLRPAKQVAAPVREPEPPPPPPRANAAAQLRLYATRTDGDQSSVIVLSQQDRQLHLVKLNEEIDDVKLVEVMSDRAVFASGSQRTTLVLPRTAPPLPYSGREE